MATIELKEITNIIDYGIYTQKLDALHVLEMLVKLGIIQQAEILDSLENIKTLIEKSMFGTVKTGFFVIRVLNVHQRGICFAGITSNWDQTRTQLDEKFGLYELCIFLNIHNKNELNSFLNEFNDWMIHKRTNEPYHYRLNSDDLLYIYELISKWISSNNLPYQVYRSGLKPFNNSEKSQFAAAQDRFVKNSIVPTHNALKDEIHFNNFGTRNNVPVQLSLDNVEPIHIPERKKFSFFRDVLGIDLSQIEENVGRHW